jgi:hypothetical protein
VPKVLSIGGYLAAAVLIVLGIAVIVVGFIGREYVQDQIAKENIVGSEDMTPELVAVAGKTASLPFGSGSISLPLDSTRT